jgi:hypothetical protein
MPLIEFMAKSIKKRDGKRSLFLFIASQILILPIHLYNAVIFETLITRAFHGNSYW